jgi:hypothetical protein
MRVLLGLILIVYLVGVGVALAPEIRSKWNDATASDLAGSISQALPRALAWPATAYRSVTVRVDPAPRPS